MGANLLMYARARGWTKSSDSRWFSALKNSLSKPMDTPANRPLDDLRKRVEELERRKIMNDPGLRQAF